MGKLCLLHNDEVEIVVWHYTMLSPPLVDGRPRARYQSTGVEKRATEGFLVQKDRFHLSHFQFADETIFFSQVKEESLVNLNYILSFFESMSELKIKKGKNLIICINCESQRLTGGLS